MIVEVHDSYSAGKWEVTLNRSNFRPERFFVEVRHEADDEGSRSWCVGFADDESQAQQLYQAARLTLAAIVVGNNESMDWAELPDGEFLE